MAHYIFRKLCATDYHNNYLQLLGQDFSINVGTISFDDFTNYIDTLPDTQQIIVIENNSIDISGSYLVGSSTIFIETKLIHNFGKVAHIEDVIVHSDFRGKGLGKLLLDKCIEIAKQNGCYKIILDCSDDNCRFYENCGFNKKGNQMAMYLLLDPLISI